MTDTAVYRSFSAMSSPTLSSGTPTSSMASNSSDSEVTSCESVMRCSTCSGALVNPKVLVCFHSFCHSCLECVEESGRVVCPVCHVETYLSSDGITGLLPDYNVSDGKTSVGSLAATINLSCTGCRKADAGLAVAHCRDCSALLCASCELAHRFMRCFDGHTVRVIDDVMKGAVLASGAAPRRSVSCPRHNSELEFMCQSCSVPVCAECIGLEHVDHDLRRLDDVSVAETIAMQTLVSRATSRAADLRTATNTIMQMSGQLRGRYDAARASIIEAYNFFCAAVEDRKQQVMRELDMAYNDRQVALSAAAHETESSAAILCRASAFAERFMSHAGVADAILHRRTLETRLATAISRVPDLTAISGSYALEFTADFQSMQSAVRSAFGQVRHGSRSTAIPPAPRIPADPLAAGMGNMNIQDPLLNNLLDGTVTRKSSSNSPDADKWNQNNTGRGSPPDIFSMADMFSVGQNGDGSHASSLSSCMARSSSTQTVPRQKMVYQCKFGEFGSQVGQFTEPSGVAVNGDGDILVADTNNHRIQVFDRDGVFKFHFGACGKHDGQLLYPNRVAVCRLTGDIVVTERSPTHQVQIFTRDGVFVRKFGANVLQHPRGVTVDFRGRIVVVECKVMRVVVFDRVGNVLHKFGCSRHLEFPNGVVANDRDEIFISDNRSHCVKVFGYDGAFLRQIGGEGVTNYPIGVGIDSAGRILVADNHNNFNATLFTPDGRLVTALESRVKHAQCFDVALADDGSVVLASKDFRVYIYRFAVGTPSVAEERAASVMRENAAKLDMLAW